MTQSYYPFDSGAGGSVAEDQWRKMARLWVPSGVPADQLNRLQSSADGTTRTVSVATGQAWIEGHFYENDAIVAVPIDAANATNPRIDRVVLRLDRTTNTILLATLTGVAAGSPAAPALTQNSSVWEIPICRVARTANQTPDVVLANQVTDEREIITGDGAWNVFVPGWGGSGGTPAIGNGLLTGAYRRQGKTVDIRIYAIMGSTTTYGGGIYNFSIPANLVVKTGMGHQLLYAGMYDSSLAQFYTGLGIALEGTININPMVLSTNGAYGINSYVGPATPFVLANGDSIQVNGRFEIE